MTPPTFAGAEQAGVERGQKWCTKGLHIQRKGLPSGKEPACQCRRQKRRGYDPWVRKFPWRRAWLLTTVFLPGESHGQRSLGGYSPRGHKESDTTEWLSTEHTVHIRQRPRPSFLYCSQLSTVLFLACTVDFQSWRVNENISFSYTHIRLY